MRIARKQDKIDFRFQRDLAIWRRGKYIIYKIDAGENKGLYTTVKGPGVYIDIITSLESISMYMFLIKFDCGMHASNVNML